jgi:hypothetical protein
MLLRDASDVRSALGDLLPSGEVSSVLRVSGHGLGKHSSGAAIILTPGATASDAVPATYWYFGPDATDDWKLIGVRLECDGTAARDAIERNGALAAPMPPRGKFTVGGIRVTLSYPGAWSETDAQAMPYASCEGCMVLGPPRPAHAHGIQMFSAPLEPSCATFCWTANRLLPHTEPRRMIVDGHDAWVVEFERQAPLGLVEQTAGAAPYREIITQVHLGGEALYVSGFYREEDVAGEVAVRAVYDDVLATVRVEASPPGPLSDERRGGDEGR